MIADARAEGLSVANFCAMLPHRRSADTAGGLLLFIPRTGLTVVPMTRSSNGWTVAVVEGNESFQPGGYNLRLANVEIETAIERNLGELKDAA